MYIYIYINIYIYYIYIIIYIYILYIYIYMYQDICMGYMKIINLMDDIANQLSKFRAKILIEITNNRNVVYAANKNSNMKP